MGLYRVYSVYTVSLTAISHVQAIYGYIGIQAYTRIWAISWIWGIQALSSPGLYMANSSEAHVVLHIGPGPVQAQYRLIQALARIPLF